MTARPYGKADGFTLIEVVTVIVLVTLLSVASLGYFRHNDTELISQTHILKTHIRYAQARAMNTDTVWGIHFQASTPQYWLFQDPAINQKIALPGETADHVDLDAMGLAITGANFNLTFDSWGRPTATDRTFTGGQLILNLNRGDTQSDPITITANTGFIP
jgi:prepilin-type N-terminal cleavage/methylation domain-containing protein